MHFKQIQETATFINSKVAGNIPIGVILGSGLGLMADLAEVILELPYSEIPHFPQSTVEGHAGKLIIGKLHGKTIIMMSGRFHYYEGYSMQEVTFPVRVMQMLGVRTLLISNAAGGINPSFKVGDIMLIKDHINLFPEHPLRGKNDSRWGVRFPDMSEPYCLDLLTKARKLAFEMNIPIQEGVYAGLQGPSFETRAEYKWLHTIGADAVGMSTVPEVIVAVHGNMHVFAASIIANIGIREERNTVTHEEVLEASGYAASKLSAIFAALVQTMDNEYWMS